MLIILLCVKLEFINFLCVPNAPRHALSICSNEEILISERKSISTSRCFLYQKSKKHIWYYNSGRLHPAKKLLTMVDRDPFEPSISFFPLFFLFSNGKWKYLATFSFFSSTTRVAYTDVAHIISLFSCYAVQRCKLNVATVLLPINTHIPDNVKVTCVANRRGHNAIA